MFIHSASKLRKACKQRLATVTVKPIIINSDMIRNVRHPPTNTYHNNKN